MADKKKQADATQPATPAQSNEQAPQQQAPQQQQTKAQAAGQSAPAGAAKPVGGAADDTSVREFGDKVAELTSLVLARDFIGAVRAFGGVASVVADLFGMGGLFGAKAPGDAGEAGDGTADCSEDEALLDDAVTNCDACKKSLATPKAAAGDAGEGDEAPDAKQAAIDKPTILAILDLVMKFIEMLRNRPQANRQPNPQSNPAP